MQWFGAGSRTSRRLETPGEHSAKGAEGEGGHRRRAQGRAGEGARRLRTQGRRAGGGQAKERQQTLEAAQKEWLAGLEALKKLAG
jgi:hypothetical protein